MARKKTEKVKEEIKDKQLLENQKKQSFLGPENLKNFRGVGKTKEKTEEISVDVFSEQVVKKEEKISRKELEEKAKKLAEKIEGKEEESLKEKLEEEREKEKQKLKTLVPIEDYLKYGVYIGTKVITPHMRQYVYRRRNDGIAIINTNIIDKKLKEFAELLAKYSPEDFILICKREAGWKAAEEFSELTGVRVFTKKYPAGILTNIKLPSFFETEMVFICDPWMDRNAMNDAKKIKKPVFGLCDTNNYTFDIDFVVPCNNKAGKSLGLIFYILAREYLKARKIDKKLPEIKDFMIEE